MKSKFGKLFTLRERSDAAQSESKLVVTEESYVARNEIRFKYSGAVKLRDSESTVQEPNLQPSARK